jgi:membrane associated rhomboid family serine protease
MGIQDRDYYRDGSNSFLEAWGRQGAVLYLVVITSVLFFAQMIAGGPRGEVYELGKYSYEKVLSGEIWRLITPFFLHPGLWQLFINMFVLYWAGSRLEEIYGAREIVAFYLVAGVFAEVTSFLAQAAGISLPNAIPAGASGPVMAVFVLFAMHYPRQKVPVWLLMVIFVAMDFLGASVEKATIAYFNYLGGALFALLYFRTGLRLTSLFVRSPGKPAVRTTRPSLRLLPVESDEVESTEDERAEPVGAAVESQPRAKEAADEHLEAKLDRVLEKLSQTGQESLTQEEREILVKASEVYKRRRK